MASLWDGLNSDFATRLRQLVAESGGRITLVSGYRSQQRQEQLFAEAINKYGRAEAENWVAVPKGMKRANGKISTGSNHNHGSAMDLGGDLKLAHMLAPKYGLRFPMAHEPWHIEPIDLESHADAYTTVAQPAEDEDTGENHVDQIFNNLKGLFGENMSEGAAEFAGASGNAANTGNAGEWGSSSLSEGATGTTPTATATTTDEDTNMSGATQSKFTSGGVDANRQIGKKLAAEYGWSDGGEWTAFNNLVIRESGWNAAAANPTSSARGIAQNIKGYSNDYQENNAEQQIKWMLDYVKNRYGSPSKAIAFHDKNNWY